MGYSLVAGLLCRIGAQARHVSAPFNREGWYPEVFAGMAQTGPVAAQSMKQ
jgi:hypothetical protein